MTRVRVEGFTISLDGYAAGPDQNHHSPVGVGGTELHEWLHHLEPVLHARRIHSLGWRMFGRHGYWPRPATGYLKALQASP